jgi:hypothetical protein
MIDHRVSPDDSMNYEQLIEYINHPAVPMSFQNKARFILHKRKTISDNRMLYMTAAILILTILIAYAEFFHKVPSTPVPVHTEKVQSQQLYPAEKSEEPQSKSDKTKIITHSTTSTKRK